MLDRASLVAQAKLALDEAESGTTNPYADAELIGSGVGRKPSWEAENQAWDMRRKARSAVLKLQGELLAIEDTADDKATQLRLALDGMASAELIYDLVHARLCEDYPENC